MSEKKEYEYTPFSYESFKESDTTKGYGQLASDWEKTVSGWGDYTWDRQGEYDTLFKNYQNRPDFSYDFNTDALYQQYKDKYIQQGKMAMQDTIGQASAMTGGYGNSYATTAGSQAYQASLQNLNDVIPELYQLALNRYNQKGQDMLNQLGILSNERTFDYGAWSDKYNRAVGNRDYYGTRYDNSLSNDWTMYDSNRDLAYSDHTTAEGYEYQTGRDAIADEQWEKSYNLSERELQMAEDQWEWQKEQASSGNGGNGGNSGGNNTNGATYADTLWTATGTKDDKGNPIFRNSEGKTQAYAEGINPYTGTKNKDAKNGTFSNGYQPNNINGTKLKNSGMSTNVTGKNQTIWEANGKYWLWRGDLNKYIEVDVSDLD